jgi:DoxX
MAATTTAPRGTLRDPASQGYLLLRITFVIVPILSGLDKFFNLLVEWPKYLAPWVNDLMPGTAQEFMYVVGGIEIIAGVIVLISPEVGEPARRRLAGRDHRQPPDDRSAEVLRHRGARLRPDVGSAHPQPACDCVRGDHRRRGVAPPEGRRLIGDAGYQVTAPLEAEPTSRAYLASAPLS